MKSKTYRAASVKDVKISDVVLRLAEGPVWASLDVGKGHSMVVIRDVQGTTPRRSTSGWLQWGHRNRSRDCEITNSTRPSS